MTLADLVSAVISWPSLVVVVLTFGFFPGAALRLIVLAFPKDDPRRDELKAEVYAVPYIERPLWVAQQLEVALFEGLWGRIKWAATGRIIHRWHLKSGVAVNAEHPTFEIPNEAERLSVHPGIQVKLYFGMKVDWAERMWVLVDKQTKKGFEGTLTSSPLAIPRLTFGDRIKFRQENIIDILWEELPEDYESQPPLLLCPCCDRARGHARIINGQGLGDGTEPRTELA